MTQARRRLRQVDLAAELGWSPPIASALEQGRRRVTMADMVRLCRALGVDLRGLLGGVNEDDLQVLGLERRRR